MEGKVREIGNAERIIRKRTIALFTIIIILLQMFLPYGVLMDTTDAVTTNKSNILTVVTASDMTYKDNVKGFKVTFAITAPNVNSTDFNIHYDSTKIKPVNRNKGTEYKGDNKGNMATTVASCYEQADLYTQLGFTNNVKTINVTDGIIRINSMHPAGKGSQFYLGDPENEDNGYLIYTKEELGEDVTHGYDYWLPVCSLYFYIVDNSVTELTKDMLNFELVNSGMPTGYKIIYNDGVATDKTVYDLSSVAYEGFAEGSKTATKMEVIQEPTDLTYNNGQKLDFAGGKIKITYDDGTEEEQDIQKLLGDGIITVDSEYASGTNKKAVFTHAKTTSVKTNMPYYTLTNVTEKTTPSPLTFEYDEKITFTDGKLELTYTNCNNETTTEELSIPLGITSGTITLDKEKAMLTDPTVKLTYEGFNFLHNLTVTDPIVGIEVVPGTTSVVYDDTKPINFVGGAVRLNKKSGASSLVEYPNDNISVITTKADISEAYKTWQRTDNTDLTAGFQKVTIQYKDPANASNPFIGTYDITVNDSILSVEILTQPTAKNKWGETNPSFAGLTAKVITTGGGEFTANHTSLTIDMTGYSSTSLDPQSFNVSYGSMPATGQATIQLEDYIKNIKDVTFATTEFEYDTPLASVIDGATYTKVYASGKEETNQPVTTDMVSGYVQKPVSTLFNTSHIASETLTIKLSTKVSSFDELPKSTTQGITIKDKITGITLVKTPTPTSFGYGDKFSYSQGQVKTVYASGAEGNIIYTSDTASVTVELATLDKASLKPAKESYVGGVATENVVITYTKDGVPYTANYNITIEDSITGIAITKDPVKEFKHGEFDSSTGEITLTYVTGRTENLPMNDPDVTITKVGGTAINKSPAANDYSSDYIYTQTLEVGYTGFTGTKPTYEITTINDVKSIELISIPKTEYSVKETEDLNVEGTKTPAQIKVTRAVGDASYVDLDRANDKLTITGWATDKIYTDKPVSVTYTENKITSNTVTYNINVTDTVSKLEWVTKPETKFKYDTDLDVTGGELKATMSSGEEVSVILDNTMINSGDNKAGNITGYTKTPSAENLGKNQTITINYGGKTATYEVAVYDYITAIKLNPTSYAGKVGDEISDILTAGVTYELEYKVAKTQGSVTVTDAMIDQTSKDVYDSASTSAQVLTINCLDNIANSYDYGDTKPATLPVTLGNPLERVEIILPTTAKVKWGESLPLSEGEVRLYTADGNYTRIDLDASMVTDDENAPSYSTGPAMADGQKTMQVTYHLNYTENTVTPPIVATEVDYVVTIVNEIEEIELTADTDNAVTGLKKKYNLNDTTFNVNKASGEIGQIEVTRANGNKEIVDLDAEGVQVTPPDLSTIGLKTVNISYTDETSVLGTPITKNTSYTVNVVDEITSIVLTTPPTKDKYKYGLENLDVIGGEITCYKGTVESGKVQLTNSMINSGDNDAGNIKGFNNIPTTLGEQEITITYNGVSTTFKVKVLDYVESITCNPASVTGTCTDTLAKIFNDNTIKYTVKYKVAGVQPEVILKETDIINGAEYNPVLTTAQTMKFNYHDTHTDSYDYDTDLVGSFKIILSDNIESLKLKEPDKKVYKYGEPLNLDGGQITPVKLTGDEPAINLSDLPTGSISVFDPHMLGTQTITIKYGGKTVFYDVEVKDYVEEIKFTPDKITEPVNTELDDIFNKYTITYEVKYASKNTKETPVVITKDDIENILAYDKTTTEEQTFKISYNDTNPDSITFGSKVEGAFKIKLTDGIAEVKLISIPDKLNYKFGEMLDLTNGMIEVTYSSGITENKPLSISMISGYNPNSVGTQTITVIYEGITAGTFDINIEDDIKELKVIPPDKTAYIIGEELVLNGGKAQVIMLSGQVSEQVDLTEYMISGYDKDKEGTQEIIVTYKGLTGRFTVSVGDNITGIVLLTPPDKTTYEYGENLIVDGATIMVVKASGNMTIPVTSNMISGYNPYNPGMQKITVTYEGFTATFSVYVKEQEENKDPVAPVTPSQPTEPTKPNTPSTPSNNTPSQNTIRPITTVTKKQKAANFNGFNTEPIRTTIKKNDVENVVDKPTYNKPTNDNTKTEVLGVQDKTEEKESILPYILAMLGLLLLLLILILKNNVKIYVDNRGGWKQIGGTKISKKNPSVDADKHLTPEMASKTVKVRINKEFSKKLDGEEVAIKYQDHYVRFIVKYNEEPFEYIIEEKI